MNQPALQVLKYILNIRNDLKDVKEAIGNVFSEVDCLQLDELRLDIVPTGVSKLNGVLYLAERLGIPRNEIVSIGDDLDDIEMIESAGLGVAMGNAPLK